MIIIVARFRTSGPFVESHPLPQTVQLITLRADLLKCNPHVFSQSIYQKLSQPLQAFQPMLEMGCQVPLEFKLTYFPAELRLSALSGDNKNHVDRPR
jgi:hypothetical protein